MVVVVLPSIDMPLQSSGECPQHFHRALPFTTITTIMAPSLSFWLNSSSSTSAGRHSRLSSSSSSVSSYLGNDDEEESCGDQLKTIHTSRPLHSFSLQATATSLVSMLMSSLIGGNTAAAAHRPHSLPAPHPPDDHMQQHHHHHHHQHPYNHLDSASLQSIVNLNLKNPSLHSSLSEPMSTTKAVVLPALCKTRADSFESLASWSSSSSNSFGSSQSPGYYLDSFFDDLDSDALNFDLDRYVDTSSCSLPCLVSSSLTPSSLTLRLFASAQRECCFPEAVVILPFVL